MEKVLIANKLVPQLYEISAQILRIVFCRAYRSFRTYKTSKLQKVSRASTKALSKPKIHLYSSMTSNIFLGKWIVLFFSKPCKMDSLTWKTYISAPTLVKKGTNITDPLIQFSFVGGTFSFFGWFWWKRCQNAQGYILLHMRWSPREFETWPFFYPCIAHIMVMFVMLGTVSK